MYMYTLYLLSSQTMMTINEGSDYMYNQIITNNIYVILK